MANELNQIEQIDSELDNVSQVDSELENISQIDSDLGNIVPIMMQYEGLENDLIKVEVDNTNKTIEAKAKTYIYEQGIASSTWTIVHNLNKFPSVTVIDSAGDQVFANLKYINQNELILDFNAGFSGKAYLN